MGGYSTGSTNDGRRKMKVKLYPRKESHMTKVQRRIILIAAALLLLIPLTLASFAQDDSLRPRVSSFYSAWKEKNPGAVWNLLSSRLKKSNEVKKYTSELQQLFGDVELSSAEPIETKFMSADVASVHTKLLVRIKSEDFRSEVIEEKTKWVKENNQWYYDGKELPPPSR